jgi:hypothetical protein
LSIAGETYVQKVIRQKGFAEFLSIALPTLERALRDDPDYAHVRRIKIGPRAVGHPFEDALRVYLRKLLRAEGVKPERLDAAVEERLTDELAKQEMVAAARARLEAKTRSASRAKGADHAFP